VALSGDGGDELFGGYQSFLNMDRLRFADALPQALRKAISAVAAWLPYGAYGKNYLRMISRPTDLERYLDNNYCPHHLMRRLLAPEWMPPADGSALSLALRDFLAPDQADIVTKAMYFEATARLTGDMLVKVDRASMANSLEVRCPLLDHVLAEFAMSLPYRWKVYDGAGKRILLKAMRDRLPKGLLDRKKMGFAIPVARWFRGPLLELLRDHLLGKQFLERGMVSPQFVAALIEEHVAGRRDNSYWLFGLIMLELWFREWGN
jgi:asparagine synthase (glutamine-hydrolysing)